MRLYFLDECGFSPTQPVGYSWAAAGERRRVRYEATARRRVNALAAYCPLGPWRGLHFRVVSRTLNAADTLHFLQSLRRPGAPPAWVVLDNGKHPPQPAHPACPSKTGPPRSAPLLPAAVQPRTQRHRARLRRHQGPRDA
ncbi:hypothetical protein D7W81_12285 [Corallococcus aberystwythensis]|uniref:Tc1-like transposase DDE domain-containing protein n=1 Tax=Corallococcus aberystwythensis TaxID=2316722 RepID=A0A3A8QUS8_9BACT|nr:hypothetical protein D7W81_12285 [Corallococcus aberystwythensis]